MKQSTHFQVSFMLRTLPKRLRQETLGTPRGPLKKKTFHQCRFEPRSLGTLSKILPLEQPPMPFAKFFTMVEQFFRTKVQRSLERGSCGLNLFHHRNANNASTTDPERIRFNPKLFRYPNFLSGTLQTRISGTKLDFWEP